MSSNDSPQWVPSQWGITDLSLLYCAIVNLGATTVYLSLFSNSLSYCLPSTTFTHNHTFVLYDVHKMESFHLGCMAKAQQGRPSCWVDFNDFLIGLSILTMQYNSSSHFIGMMNDWEEANINLIYSTCFPSLKDQDGIARGKEREREEVRSLCRKRGWFIIAALLFSLISN